MTALIMAVAQVKFSSDIQFDTIAEDWHVFEGSREPFKRWVGRQLEIVNNETASSPINIAPETQMFLGGMNLNLDEVRYELEGIKNIMQWLEDKPHDGYIIAMGGSVKLLIMSAAQIKFPGMWLDTRTGDWHVLAEDHPLLKQWVDDRLSEIEANKNVALLEGEGAILDLDKVKSDLEDIQKTMEEQRGDQLFEHYDISMGGDTKLLIMSAAQVQFPYDIQFNAFTENWYVAWKDPRQFEQWVGRQLDIVNALSASSPINQYDIDIGNAYWNGDLITTPITRPFRASLKEDVKDMTTLTEQEAVLSERFALESLLRGEGYIGILLAGASGRMNVDKAPKDARNMVGGRKIKSKAAVPVGKVDGRVITYLDAFGISVARLLMEIESAAQKEGQESKVMQNDIGFLSNDRYRSEHDEILLKNNFYGLSPELFRFYHQPVGAKFVGTPEEVEKLNAQGKFNTEEDYLEALEYSKTIAERRKTDPSVVVLKGEADPLGHGEFFHQMILSGELLHMHDTGKKWVFIRNIDNYAAKFDKKWLQILGAFLAEQLDFQGEVSPRSPGLKGGNLIVMTDTGSHQIAETPNIDETNKIRKKKGETPIKDSYWFNNAVGLMTIRYIISLYKKEGQADKGFIQELRYASESQLTEIANRGREKFPKILDPKPAKNMGAAAVKAETNLWQSTGVVDDDIMKVRGIGVRGGRNFPINDYLDGTISPKQKQEELANLRFLATKQWVVTSKRKEDLRGSINRAMVENGIDRTITDEELALTFESYEGNKLLVNDILRYILETESVTDGILNNNALRRLVSESNVFNEKEEAAENASSPITLETIEARLTDATVATDQFEESLDEFVGGLAKNEMMPALDALKRMATTVGESTPKGGVLTAYSKVLIGDISREIKKDVPRGDSTVSSPIVPTKTIKTERDAIKAMRVYLKNPEVKRINRKGSGPKDVSSHYILQLYWYTHL
ncbi:MAG: UTP--glucose-1-phosphate uridylyltransferase, partial [Candidatus Omnitrophica bacterium]|nr:UTP--glucose-1-phosphate uridylyltransferase [Candidatus Omnitrophota bacterium]